MIIDLKTIPHGGERSFDFILEKDWWKSSDEDSQVLGPDGPLTVKIKIYKAGERYALEGEIAGGFQVICDRCLETYHRDVSSDFKIFLDAPSEETDKAEIELLEEDMAVGFLRGEEVDLNVIIQEQVYLSLPIKFLCREDCLGLCPVCGCNLNEQECKCEKKQGHPGFSKLKNLKI